MKRVKVLIPFIDGETKKTLVADSEVVISERTVKSALAISPNMLIVLGDAEEKPKTTKKKSE